MKNISINKQFKKIAWEENFICNPMWLIIARFFTVVLVLLTIIVSYKIFSIKTFNYTALLKLNLIFLISNLGYWIYYKKSSLSKKPEQEKNKKHLSVFTLTQINIDLIIFTLLIHFSGGATNPFVVYYLFPIMFSSIMLTKKAAYIEAFIAAILFNGMTIFEGLEFIKHYTFVLSGYNTQITFITGMSFVLTSSLFMTVYIIIFINDRYRIHRNELEQAREETERLKTERTFFFDIIAYDLKSSVDNLNTIVTSTLSDYKEKMSHDIIKNMNNISKDTNKLTEFSEGLIEFSKIKNVNQLQIKFTPLNFLPIVTATVEMYMNQALDKNILLNLVQTLKSLSFKELKII